MSTTTAVQAEIADRLDEWWVGKAIAAMGLRDWRPREFVGTERPWPRPVVNTEQLLWLLNESGDAAKMPTEPPTGRKFFTWRPETSPVAEADRLTTLQPKVSECLVCGGPESWGPHHAADFDAKIRPANAHRFVDRHAPLVAVR